MNEPPGTPTSGLCQGGLDQAAIRPPGCIQVLAGPQDFFPYGVTAYIHGVDLDRPLSIYRDDHSVEQNAMRIQPIANWKGDFVTGAFDDGTAADCMASNQPSCIDIQWPGERVWHGWENKDPELVQKGPRHWMGSLVYGSADASGLLYRRNRYYDPVAGQFTQEDPIGIAGGINLYGFAGGDPVNFSDPFGLSPACIPCLIEIGASLFDLGDLAATTFGFFRGDVSGQVLGITALGAAAGFATPGGGLGRAGRAFLEGLETVGGNLRNFRRAGSQARRQGIRFRGDWS